MDHPTTTDRTGQTVDRRVDERLAEIREQRARLRTRHAQALTALMEERTDLRGVHALADHLDDAVRWSA
jgi:hypothetical protein